MTEYDQIVKSAQVSEDELPVLIGFLVQIANADGVFSPEEHAFLSGIVEFFTDDHELAKVFLDSTVSIPDDVEFSCPEVAILLSYMLAYTDGSFSAPEELAIKLLATRLGVSDERCSELHRLVKKKIYNMVLFNVYEDRQKTTDEKQCLEDLRATLSLNMEDAKEEEKCVCQEIKELINA